MFFKLYWLLRYLKIYSTGITNETCQSSLPHAIRTAEFENEQTLDLL